MDQNNIIECGGFYFIHNFDSGNLGHVERVPTELIVPSIVNNKTNATETPDYEFNLWTRPDCAGTEFENGNRTWFYFGVQASEPNVLVRLNIINLNKQGKMYNQGMAPVTRTLPGKPQWERIRDRPVHSTDDNTFTLGFKYRTADNVKATTFFAFTYPYSFAELQIALNSIDLKMLPLPPPQTPDDIYYCRECLVYSLEGRRVDLLTITSHHGITSEKEDRLRNLFPDSQERPFKFNNKKIIFISARVHPGETPSSFVFNGFLNLLLTRHDPIAIHLRKLYVFKMIPFLNPDGVARGHYRTDTRGVNLNRVYLNPTVNYHPTVYASRALIRYYHFGCEKEDICDDSNSLTSRSIQNISESTELIETKKKKGTKTPSSKVGEYCKRDKAKPGVSKSATTIKQPSSSLDSSRKETTGLAGEATNLADQVCDMSLREMPSQTSELSLSLPRPRVRDIAPLLDDDVLRTCLGSNVHLSTSEELNLQGTNPLRPLRDTLKNSISLLMESSPSMTGESLDGTESRLSSVKMGWCQECRRAVSKMEDSMPGLASMLPGYSSCVIRDESPTYANIEEYREHQRQQLDDQERKTLEESDKDAEKVKDDSVYFCTNCFKRYMISDNNEEIKVRGASTASEALSAGDGGGGGVRAPQSASKEKEREKDHEKDKDEKMKSPQSAAKVPKKKPSTPTTFPVKGAIKDNESGLFLYIDLHGHASKKGIFMYGNHFEDLESSVECMLLPRIMSLNNLHFHFSSCNFTERNMYLKDRRDGMSREGSGRVAVLKATGLVRSYTLECNYNTGRLVNVLPPAAREAPQAVQSAAPAPPKYTPHIFEEVGRSLGASILDLTGQHPNSRVPASEHRSLPALRDWLRAHTKTMRPQLTMSRLRPNNSKAQSPTRAPLYTRPKGKTDERKENTYVGAKSDARPAPPAPAPALALKYAKREPPPPPPRAKVLEDVKPRTLATKRRNILAIRKPNAAKPLGKTKMLVLKGGRRSAGAGMEEAAGPAGAGGSLGGKVGPRTFARARPPRRAPEPWPDAHAAKRRPAALPCPDHLKKSRLKSAL